MHCTKSLSLYTKAMAIDRLYVRTYVRAYVDMTLLTPKLNTLSSKQLSSVKCLLAMQPTSPVCAPPSPTTQAPGLATRSQVVTAPPPTRCHQLRHKQKATPLSMLPQSVPSSQEISSSTLQPEWAVAAYTQGKTNKGEQIRHLSQI